MTDDAPLQAAESGPTTTRRARSRLAVCLLVLLTTIVFAAAGGACGWWLTEKEYESTGMVHLKPYLSYLLAPSDMTGLLPAYESFRDAQVTLLQQEAVIKRAMMTPEWRALGRSQGPDEELAHFTSHLRVELVGGELVSVQFRDRDPKACETAVKGVLDAYYELYIANQDKELQNKIDTLDKMRLAVGSERDACRDAIRSFAREIGSDDLRPLQQAMLQQLARLESEDADAQVKLAALPESAKAERDPLVRTRAQYAKLIEGLQVEIKSLGVKIVEIDRRKQEEADKSARFAELTRRIEILRTESRPAARIQIISEGDMPMPVPKPLDRMLIGAVIGALVGLGIGMLLFGRRREGAPAAANA